MESEALVAFRSNRNREVPTSTAERGGREGTSAASEFTVHLCSSVARNSGGCQGGERQPQTARISPSSLLFRSGSQVTRRKRKRALLSAQPMSPCGGIFPLPLWRQTNSQQGVIRPHLILLNRVNPGWQRV